MRAAIYARYSSDLQNSRSIEDQLRDCHALCARNGWTVVDTFSDAAISGTTMRRPGLTALLELAAAGRFEVVVAEALDRISRGLANTAQIHEDLTDAKIRIHTLSEGDVRLIDVGLKGTMNALFISELRSKISRGQRGNIANGRTAGGLSYGYRVVKKFDASGKPIGGLREIDPEKANVIRRIYAEYNSGVSPRIIRAALIKEGIPGPRGGGWSVSTITGHRQRACGILHNELYRGVLTFNRTRKQKNKATGREITRLNTEDQWVRQVVPDLRIVDDETWEKAQSRKLEHHAGGAKPNAVIMRRPKRILSGLVKCARCSGPFIHADRIKLVCRNHRDYGTCDNPVRVRVEWLENRVIEELQKALLHPDAVAEFVASMHALEVEITAGAAAGRRRTAKELSDTNGKISRLITALEEGDQAPSVVMTRLRDLEVRKGQLEKDLANSEPAKLIRLQTDTLALYKAKIEGLHQALTIDATPEELAEVQTALTTLVEAVLIHWVPTGLRRKGGGMEVEIVGLLPQYLASHPYDLPAWALEKDNQNKQGIDRGVSVERVKGIEPSS